MTISKEIYCNSTESLVTFPKRFYPVKIPVPHHQLRHFISAAEGDRIYYATKYDIYSLNLGSNQQTLLATLPFDARCLTAGHGWICVGGEENGDCAFLKIKRNEYTGVSKEDAGHLAQPRCFGHDLVVKELGGEIVNAMKIHNLPIRDSSGEEEPIVLISNNDKTVKIYSLAQQKIVTTLKHPVPMNYAAISPDSNTLVAVGDSNEVFLYMREPASGKNSSDDRYAESYSNDHWRPCGNPTVPVGDTVYKDYSFSVAFSPSGHLCAVSSQGGMITVFDIEILRDLPEGEPSEKAILCSFRSSRQALWGCVRSMTFSPEPWDLLAWAEDHGRIGIADVRQSFVRRQILKLDDQADDVERVEVEDLTPFEYQGMSVEERLKMQHRERPHTSRGPDHISSRTDQLLTNTRAEEARRREMRREVLSYHQALDLDARERSVLEALETTMDEMQQDIPPSRYPYSITYISRGGDSPDSLGSDDPERGARNREAAVGRTAGNRIFLPRRRESVILSLPRDPTESSLASREVSRNRLTASPLRIPPSAEARDSLPHGLSTNDLTPTPGGSSSQPVPYNIPTSAPWHVIQSALESARAADNAMASTILEYQRSTEAEDQAANPSLLTRESLPTPPSIRAVQPSTPTSAQTTALPTTNVQPADQTQQVIQTLRRHEDTRRRQLAHIESLERQVRRAESRVALASSDIQALEDAITRGVNSDRHARILEARAQARARAAANASASAAAAANGAIGGSSNPGGRPSVDGTTARTQNAAQRAENRLEARRGATTELLSRVSDRDMGFVRLMLMSAGPRQAVDRNGNWVAGDALQRLMATRDGREAINTDGTGGGASVGMEELIREMGVGTAGVEWSPDGHFLYAATEEGIFVFKVNLRDRMQFPAFELR